MSQHCGSCCFVSHVMDHAAASISILMFEVVIVKAPALVAIRAPNEQKLF